MRNLEYWSKKAAWTILGYSVMFSLFDVMKWVMFVDLDKVLKTRLFDDKKNSYIGSHSFFFSAPALQNTH